MKIKGWMLMLCYVQFIITIKPLKDLNSIPKFRIQRILKVVKPKAFVPIFGIK